MKLIFPFRSVYSKYAIHNSSIILKAKKAFVFLPNSRLTSTWVQPPLFLVTDFVPLFSFHYVMLD